MIWCIGAGPGNLDYLTGQARQLLEHAEVVAGFSAVVDRVRPLLLPHCEVITMGYKDQVEQLARTAERHQSGRRCAVVFMGDIHFSGFQFLERIERACGHAVAIVPGISSAQILAARGRVCFDETTFITFHRRGDLQPFQKHLIHVLEDARNAIVIPRPWDFMPKAIAQYLINNGIPPHQPLEVWEHLTQDEATWSDILENCPADFSDMSILLIRTLHPMSSQLEVTL